MHASLLHICVVLHDILLPVMQYGYEIWGMHTPGVAAADDACLALYYRQRL